MKIIMYADIYGYNTVCNQYSTMAYLQVIIHKR